jgi:hypothetical protein
VGCSIDLFAAVPQFDFQLRQQLRQARSSYAAVEYTPLGVLVLRQLRHRFDSGAKMKCGRNQLRQAKAEDMMSDPRPLFFAASKLVR